MTQRRLFWLMSWTGAVIGAALLFWGLFVGVSLRFDQYEIQEKIDAQLPVINKRLQSDGKDIRIEKLQVEVRDQLTVRATAHGKKFGKEFGVSAHAAGTPRYVPTEGAFYLDPSAIEIKEVWYNGASVKDSVLGAAKRYITNEGLQRLVTDNADKIEEWATHATESTVTRVLQRMPVYKLKDDGKGVVALALLDELTIEGDEVVVHLTLVRLMWWTFVGIAAVLLSIGFLYMLATHPGLGAAILVFGSFDS